MTDNNIISSYLEDYYWYWYCNIPRIGAVKLRKLLTIFESPKQLYKAEEKIFNELGLLTEKDISNSRIKRNNNYIGILYKKMVEKIGYYSNINNK